LHSRFLLLADIVSITLDLLDIDAESRASVQLSVRQKLEHVLAHESLT
jgi:hypothetical protein